MWLNLERTVDKRGPTGKKVITLQTAMTKKVVRPEKEQKEASWC